MEIRRPGRRPVPSSGRFLQTCPGPARVSGAFSNPGRGCCLLKENDVDATFKFVNFIVHILPEVFGSTTISVPHNAGPP
jgi:hypothetical protein